MLKSSRTTCQSFPDFKQTKGKKKFLLSKIFPWHIFHYKWNFALLKYNTRNLQSQGTQLSHGISSDPINKQNIWHSQIPSHTKQCRYWVLICFFFFLPCQVNTDKDHYQCSTLIRQRQNMKKIEESGRIPFKKIYSISITSREEGCSRCLGLLFDLVEIYW